MYDVTVLTHHGRGLPGDVDAVASVVNRHIRCIQDVDASFQHPTLKLEHTQGACVIIVGCVFVSGATT